MPGLCGMNTSIRQDVLRPTHTLNVNAWQPEVRLCYLRLHIQLAVSTAKGPWT